MKVSEGGTIGAEASRLHRQASMVCSGRSFPFHYIKINIDLSLHSLNFFLIVTLGKRV